MSDLRHNAFRTGLRGSFYKALTARISGLLYAKLWAVTLSIAYPEILLSIPKEKIAAHRCAGDSARRRAPSR